MTDYIKMWIEIIENMNNDNTYKLAWGRAILEIVSEITNVNDIYVISFEQIAEKMLKYYWNQLFFFKLKQSPSKIPVIVQETEKCIQLFILKKGSNLPVWFDYAENVLREEIDFYHRTIKRIANTLKSDVSWRFKISKGESLKIYDLDKNKKEIYLNKDEVIDLKEYAFVLSQLLNYRWAQLLEKFNNAPRIASKVKGISDAKIKRNNLKKFKDILLLQMKNGNAIDFYTGNILEENDISIDHVIPWSFMYSDDIWNLVITSKSMNSKKSNSVPSENIIKKLEERNKELLKVVDDQKYYQDLKIAIDNNYVQKFYISLKM